MHGVGSLYSVPQSRIHVEMVIHADAPEDQHPILRFDFTDDFSPQVVTLEFDLARCQRAGKCAEESAACSSHDIIDGRRMRGELTRLDAVVLCYSPVDAEQHRLIFRRKSCLPQAAFGTSNRHVGLVHDFGHPTSTLGET